MRQVLFYITVLFLSWQNLHAQDIDFKVVVDNNDVLIGDEIKLTVSLSFPTEKYALVFPNVNESFIAPFSIVRQQKIDTVESSRYTTCTQETVIALYDSGMVLLPKLYVNGFSNDSAGELNIHSDSILIRVNNVPVNIAGKIKDIYEPRQNKGWSWLLPLIITIGVLALLGLLIYLFVKRKKAPPKPIEIYPHTIGLLQKIKTAPLNTIEQQKEYFSNLTYALKWYIQNRFKINILDKTSEETIAIINASKALKILKPISNQLLNLADSVKFAKLIVSENNAQSSWVQVYDAVIKLEEQFQKELALKNKASKPNE